ncbi:hypothetical protein [Flavobacterium wongokense]|uniref:hypothetical protein n=1 Tax=Flavobacterium wongokense TaxID=2910674 RepID=UPI001F1B8EA7|nr:hypothetical protein [Flavobacterium sp. WG47]MCF6132762.1 hypothetical protein [Flavobacterium sp. WG47]
MKKIYIITFITLCFFLMPSATFACGSGKDSCKKEMSSKKAEKKNCCGNDKDSKNKDHKGCKGNCGHSQCNCSSICSVTPLTLFTEFVFENNTPNDAVIKRTRFSYTAPSISEGYYSIWLIPKIS